MKTTQFLNEAGTTSHKPQATSHKLLVCLAFLLLFIISSLYGAHARSMKLTKTGGPLWTTGITLVPGYVMPIFSANQQSITWEEGTNGLGTVTNWSFIVKNISNIIDDDALDKNNPVISYTILIDANDVANPIIMGNQVVDLLDSDPEEFAGDELTNNFRITNANNITFQGKNGKAYLKLVDGFYYGAWLLPYQPYALYSFEYDISTIPPANYQLFISGENPNASTFWDATKVQNVQDHSGTNGSSITSLKSKIDALPASLSTGIQKEFYNWNTRCYMSSMINMGSCHVVKINDLDLDGNSKNMKVGGPFGDIGIQSEPRGISLSHCHDVEVNNTNSHHFAQDGLTFGAYDVGMTASNLTITDCNFEYNGRQGFSWTGGTDVEAINCEFNHSGRAFVPGYGYLANPPVAGIDIENHHTSGNTFLSLMDQGQFTNCRFKNNGGVAILNDHDYSSMNVTFSNCTTYSHTNYGIWCRGKNYKFIDCDIYCPVVHANSGASDVDATKFIDCDFEDKPYVDENNISHDWISSLDWLVEMNNCKRTLFQNCHFKVNGEQRELMRYHNSELQPSPTIEENLIIEDCDFYYNNIGYNASGAPGGNPTLLTNVTFRGANLVQNTLTGPTNFHRFQTFIAKLEGSSNCTPSSLTFDGRILHLEEFSFKIGKLADELTDGTSKYILKNNALGRYYGNLSPFPPTLIEIGSKSTIEVNEGCSLDAYNNFFAIKGGLILKKNSFLQVITAAFSNSNGLLFIDPTCNTAQTISPLWNNYNSNPWLTNVSPLCIQGNHPALQSPTFPQCTPNYANITTNGSITILYNVSNVTCSNANDGSINLNASGGTGAINYTLQPTNATNSTGIFTNLSANNYTITATDANACSATSSFNILGSNNVAGYCCSPTSFAFSNQTTTQKLDNTTSQTYITANGVPQTGATFFINGTFTIDQSIAFTNCTIYLTPNSKIEVNANRTLTLNNCTLKAGTDCGMWDGIYANATNALVDIEDGTISDMQNGIVIENLAKLTNDGTTFKNNYLSVQLKYLPNSYNGFIKNATFHTIGNLLAPYSTMSRGAHGIKIIDCGDLAIGNGPSNKNHFENLLNGIYIKNTLNTSPTINTSYNSFKNIGGQQSLWEPYSNGLPWNQNPNGCAIFGINNVATSGIKLIHQGLNNVNNTFDFENCQRAITTNSIAVDIQDNYTQQTEAAFTCYANGQTNSIRKNTMDDTYLGIQLTGSTWGGITDNKITNLKSSYDYSSGNPAINYTFYGKGIDWQQYTPSTSGGLMIGDNEIQTIANDFIIGINLSNNSHGHVRNNIINLSSTDQTPSLSTVPNLIGLSLNRSSGLSIYENNIKGYNTTTNDARRTSGMYLQRSPNNSFSCNINDDLQHGITAVGNCTPNIINGANAHGIQQNRVKTTRYGWLFRHLTTNGTFGDVGIPNVSDANNRFHNVSGSGNTKVYRFYMGNQTVQPPIIYTKDPNDPTNANLKQSDSKSNQTNNLGAYVIDNFPLTDIVLCNPAINIAPEGSGEFNEDLALEIATEAVQYTEFETLGENFDERELYASLLNQDAGNIILPVLNTFYLNMQGTALAQLAEVDRLMALLIEPSTLIKPIDFAQYLADAKAANAVISGTEVFVQNEKQMNEYQLKVLEFGVESLTQAELSWLSQLADECPYVAGIGVLKARMLNAGNKPTAYYDDLKLCNSLGVYKSSGGNLYEQENMALDSMANQQGNQNLFNLTSNRINVFPNPASDMVTISYELNAFSKAQFQLLDMQGRMIQKIDLSNTANHVSFSVSELANAIYNYRYVVNEVVVENGKFVKE